MYHTNTLHSIHSHPFLVCLITRDKAHFFLIFSYSWKQYTNKHTNVAINICVMIVRYRALVILLIFFSNRRLTCSCHHQQRLEDRTSGEARMLLIRSNINVSIIFVRWYANVELRWQQNNIIFGGIILSSTKYYH